MGDQEISSYACGCFPTFPFFLWFLRCTSGPCSSVALCSTHSFNGAAGYLILPPRTSSAFCYVWCVLELGRFLSLWTDSSLVRLVGSVLGFSCCCLHLLRRPPGYRFWWYRVDYKLQWCGCQLDPFAVRSSSQWICDLPLID